MYMPIVLNAKNNRTHCKQAFYAYQIKRYMQRDTANFLLTNTAFETDEARIPAEQEMSKNYEYNDLFYVQGALTAMSLFQAGSLKKDQKEFLVGLLARLEISGNINSEMQPFREAFEHRIYNALSGLEKQNVMLEITADKNKQLVNKATQTDVERLVNTPTNTFAVESVPNNVNTSSVLDSHFL
jgi:hypothetical protein